MRISIALALFAVGLVWQSLPASANACSHEETLFVKDTYTAISRIATESEVFLYNNTTPCTGDAPLAQTTHLSTGFPGGDFAEAGHRTRLSAFGVYYGASFGEIFVAGNVVYNQDGASTCADAYGTERWVKYRVYWNSTSNNWEFKVDCLDGTGFHTYRTRTASDNFNVGYYAYSETARYGNFTANDAHNAERWLDALATWHTWSGHACETGLYSMTGGWHATTAFGGYGVSQNPATYFC